MIPDAKGIAIRLPVSAVGLHNPKVNELLLFSK